jgi:hypothetical protein
MTAQLGEGPSARMPTDAHGIDTPQHMEKEKERVGKWMRMMSVKKRDQGGNIAEWAWRSDGQGSKVGVHTSLAMSYAKGRSRKLM